jgi:hypothetical protein
MKKLYHLFIACIWFIYILFLNQAVLKLFTKIFGLNAYGDRFIAYFILFAIISLFICSMINGLITKISLAFPILILIFIFILCRIALGKDFYENIVSLKSIFLVVLILFITLTGMLLGNHIQHRTKK